MLSEVETVMKLSFNMLENITITFAKEKVNVYFQYSPSLGLTTNGLAICIGSSTAGHACIGNQ